MTNEALYYPYATITSNDSLNKAMLYFDRIYIINPWEMTTGDPNSNLGNIPNVNLDKLVNEGLVQYISPSELLEKYDKTISKSVLFDLDDDNFKSFCEGAGMPSIWKISAMKLPSNADPVFRKYLVNYPGIYEGQNVENFEHLEERRALYNNMKTNLQERDSDYSEYRMVKLPFTVGESIMINHALMATKDKKAVPFTDDPIHNAVLQYKVNRENQNPIYRRLLLESGQVKDSQIDLTAVQVINETVPALNEVRIDKILEFRDKNAESLKQFRAEMSKISGEIQSNYWEEDFKADVLEKIKTKITPVITQLKNVTTSNYDSTSVPFKMTVYPGSPPYRTLFASAGIGSWAAYESEQDDVKNGLSYLFAAQRTFV